MMYKRRSRLHRLQNSCSLLRTSLRLQTKAFFQNSTLHGIKYIAESDKPFSERFMWFCCFSISLIVTIIIIINLWEKFQTNPTITGMDTDYHSFNVCFPAVTVCDYSVGNETIIDEYIERKWPKLNQKTINFRKEFLTELIKYKFTNLTALKKFAENKRLQNDIPDMRTLIEEVYLTQSSDNFLKRCSFLYESHNCSFLFYPVWSEVGYCNTFNSIHFEKTWIGQYEKPEYQKFRAEDGHTFAIRAITFDSAKTPFYKLDIYVHDNRETPVIETALTFEWYKISNFLVFAQQATYTTPEAKELNIKQRKCVFTGEIDLKVDTVYTYSACVRQCKMDRSQKLCQCIPFFYPKTEGYKFCGLKELLCIIEHLVKITDTSRCSCELGCENTVYQMVDVIESEEEVTDLSVVMLKNPVVRYKRDVLFGWLDLIVSLGGIAGLFLGFGFLSAVEIVYYFILRTIFQLLYEKKTLETLSIKNNRTSKSYNLSLVPYYIKKPTSYSGTEIIWKQCKKQEIKRRIEKLVLEATVAPPFGIPFYN